MSGAQLLYGVLGAEFSLCKKGRSKVNWYHDSVELCIQIIMPTLVCNERASWR